MLRLGPADVGPVARVLGEPCSPCDVVEAGFSNAPRGSMVCLQRPGGDDRATRRDRRRAHDRRRRLRPARSDDRHPERELRGAGVKDRPDVVLADAGYWSNGHIDALRERGILPLVAPDTAGRGPRKTRLGGPYDFIRRVLATERCGGLYSQRRWMVEAVFAEIKTNRRIDRFKRRGLAARPLRVAPDRGHPQPAQAPPPHAPSREGLTTGAPTHSNAFPRKRAGVTPASLRDSLP